MSETMTPEAKDSNPKSAEAQGREQAERELCDAIVSRHPNFVDLVHKPNFNDFVTAWGAQAVVDAGSADEINALLDAYVAFIAAAASTAGGTGAGARLGSVDNPREQRTLRALLVGPVRRERLDRIAGVSNGPDVIYNLRKHMGIEIKTKRVPAIDRDQKKVTVGEYRLTERGRAKAEAWLAGGDSESGADAVGGYVDWMKEATPEELRKLLPKSAEEVELTEAELANPFIAVCFPQHFIALCASPNNKKEDYGI